MRGCVVVGIVSLAAAGCRLSEPFACSANVVPAVLVEIRDAQIGAPLDAGAFGVVRDGVFTDSLRPYTTATLQAAGERPGTYAVEVQHAGYQVWTTANIRVTQGACHVETVHVNAQLQRNP